MNITNIICLVLNEIYDDYVCFLTAYAYVYTIITCPNMPGYLHAIQCLVYTCPPYKHSL